MVMEGDLTWGGVVYYCTPETYMSLLTNVTPIRSIKNKSKKNPKKQPHSICRKNILLSYF